MLSGGTGGGGASGQQAKDGWGGYFQMPLHYPRYTRAEYETMPEWKLDCLLTQFGLAVTGDVNQKRSFLLFGRIEYFTLFHDPDPDPDQ
ncbi:hypothetical protein RJ640_012335 [Escallonia rubra]|uniref:DUF7722 domain-containing protein n=1 Tax=Escallonia rubra TaxID=112253 RepID=A0AA88RDD8_9ASTE|nr:hypothetical protein RJ640_012335 [Escallonia rubra]